ncbi:Golgi-associated kinase 1B [Paramormyrops kingsleyae]|uniref:Golgi associated kinase 1B n=1 Tax=Paramormyrops kingsleyae TaxID=1676925 RepID=A0A3B3T1R4_9TELE|nr:protein FAM198B [Paramormyrops kingsleyae]
MQSIRPGEIKGALLACPRVSLLRLSRCIRKAPAWKTTFAIAVACFIYLFFVVSRLGEVASRDKHKYRRKTGASRLEPDLREAADFSTAQNADLYGATPKSNVVYITLKAKREKPALLRGTVRPESRKKITAIDNHIQHDAFNAFDKTNEDEWKPRTAQDNEIHMIPGINIHYTLKNNGHEDSPKGAHHSYIRIYSERAPPWFSKEDMHALRFLADSRIIGIKEVSSGLLLFEGATGGTLRSPDKVVWIQGGPVCQGRCGLLKRAVDMSEVFAFHLDRILGLNRSIPTVCRRIGFSRDGDQSPAVLWDSSLAPTDGESHSSIRLTWGAYQRSLKHKCWHRGITPRAEWGCTSIHHYEWSKLALFDFLLQIYNRLDRNCCGFKPQQEDRCVELGHHLHCAEQDNISLVHIVHRMHDTRRLVFIDNEGYFDRNEDNLDFKLLDGIKELPEQAVSVLQSQRLRERLLQSLFLDQMYWESQGGRQGVEKLIDVIERRAEVLLTYINAHGIKVVAMDE